MHRSTDLELVARQLAAHSQRIRTGIAHTKRSIVDALEDIAETAQEIDSSRERLAWLARRLAMLRAAVEDPKLSDDEREGHVEEIGEWEEEEEEELEHMHFLTMEHDKMLSHRRLLVRSLVTMARHLLQVRAQERSLAETALRMGIVRLRAAKQAA